METVQRIKLVGVATRRARKEQPLDVLACCARPVESFCSENTMIKFHSETFLKLR